MAGEDGSTIKKSWKIPLFDLSFGEEEKEAVSRVLSSGWITLGEETEQFEQEFARYVGTKYALFFSSGTAALHVAYISAGIKKESRVLVPSYTFVSTVTPLIWCGAHIIFGEISGERNLNLSHREIDDKKPEFAVYVPIAGFMEGLAEFAEESRKRKVVLIEDCSHAHGSILNGKRCGTFGKVGVYSLYSNKNMTTGEGGMLVTDDIEIYKKAKLLRSHGMTRLAYERYRGESEVYDIVEIGYNYRATEMQAAIGRVQLKKLDRMNEKRRELVRLYRSLFAEVNEIKIPFTHFGTGSNYIFPILVPAEKRAAILHKLTQEGIQTSWHYRPVHTFSAIKKKVGLFHLPLTESIAQREITLPLYPDMSPEMVREVVNATKDSL